MASTRQTLRVLIKRANVKQLSCRDARTANRAYSGAASAFKMSSDECGFPPLHIVHPSSNHRRTILMLHGLGSTGPAFADAFFSSKVTCDLRVRFPDVRWVFPTAVTRSVPLFKSQPLCNKSRPAWFSIESISDLEECQQAQMEGLSQTVEHLTNVVENEIASLQAINRNRKDFFVLGRSQGSSAAVWTILNCLKSSQGIGGLILAGSWLVFARSIVQTLCRDYEAVQINQDAPSPSELAEDFVVKALAIEDRAVWIQDHGLLETPIHVSHSTDDIWISIALGRQMRDVLKRLGCKVQWKEYTGAEGEGHWLREPEEFDAIADFIESQLRLNEPDAID